MRQQLEQVRMNATASYVLPFGPQPGSSSRFKNQQDMAWTVNGRPLSVPSLIRIVARVGTRNWGQHSRLFQVCPDGSPFRRATVGAPYSPAYHTIDGEQFLISCFKEPVDQFLVMLDWVLPQ